MIFIVNPKSGSKSNLHVKDMILREFPHAEIVFTERAGHAIEIAKSTLHTQVIAVGGDGTINEAASALIGTNKIFGLIPRGSGNGFARELGFSLKTEEALLQLKEAHARHIDAASANGEYFLNLAGVGIEADIAHAFSVHGARGMWPYFWLGAKQIFTYKPKYLKVTCDGKTKEIRPLTLVFANGRQYGSNFIIAPKASFKDGFLDMTEVPDKNFFSLLISLPSFFWPRLERLNPCITNKVKEVLVEYPGEIVYHIDGEPRVTNNELTVKIIPHALTILLP